MGDAVISKKGAADDAGNVPEMEFAQDLGIARDRIVELRKEHLTQGADFIRMGNAVVLRPDGVEKLRKCVEGLCEAAKKEAALSGFTTAKTAVAKALGGILEKVEARQEKNAAQNLKKERDTKKSAEVKAQVCRIYPNPKYMQGQLADGEKIRIRVKNNRNFTPKMSVMVVHEQSDLYRYDGAMPRRRGRL